MQSLQKKVGRAEETEKENLKIHQLNLNLAGELEDYRHQTKTLMADLRAKEDEIASLRETVGTRGQLSSDVSDTYSVLGAGHVCDCVCVCVLWGDRGEREGKGDREECDQKDQRLGDFCPLHYTRQLSGQNYMYFEMDQGTLYASVFCACAALAYHIVITQSYTYKHKSRTRTPQP